MRHRSATILRHPEPPHTSKPVPGLADAGRLPALDQSGDEVHFLRTKLVRERNRVEHALRAALRLAEGR